MKRFKSPKHIYARVKEEMKAYFNTGAIDDLMFEPWTRDTLDKFECTYLPLREAVLDLHNYKCELPCDFKSAKEVWMVATINKGPITSPHVYYYQTDCRISPDYSTCSDCVDGYQCLNPQTQTPTEVALPSLCDVPEQYWVMHKVMNQLIFSFNVVAMLKPGNYKTLGKCDSNCANAFSQCIDTFDISGNSLITSFPQGSVYLAYYGEPVVEEGTDYYEIPDNDPFEKYLYHYLRFMIYQMLFDQSTDETFNQMRAKRDDAEQRANSAYINAKNYAVSSDVSSLEKNIVRSYNRFNRFRIK